MKSTWLVSVLSPAAFVMPLYAADYLSETQAQKILFPTADAFSAVNVSLTDTQLKEIKKRSGVRQRTDKPQVWKALQKEKVVGYFFIDNVVGKHEFITYATAISPEGAIVGVEIMIYRETHGGEIRDSKWRSHFKGKTLSDPFKLDQDVPNITGATLSSRNVLDGVKRLLVLQELLRHEKLL